MTVRSSLVIGSGGMLGGAVVARLRARGDTVLRAEVPWHDEQGTTAVLASAVRRLATQPGQVALWWCAGAGVTATSAQALAREVAALGRLVAQLRELLRERPDALLVFASSAGGVYAGAEAPPFTETTEPRPLAPYGRAKLEAEALFAQLADQGARVVLPRLANLFGPGQDLAKPQGLISQLCLAHYTRSPVQVYVPLDTLRDYLTVEDAAARCVALAELAEPGRVLTKIICSGRAVSVGHVLAELRRVLRRRVPVVLAASPRAATQVRDLRLRSVVYPELDAAPTATLAAGIARVSADIGTRLRRGELAG